jgi:hypothetical protein
MPLGSRSVPGQSACALRKGIWDSTYDKAELVRGFGIQCYACNPLMNDELNGGIIRAAYRHVRRISDIAP